MDRVEIFSLSDWRNELINELAIINPILRNLSNVIIDYTSTTQILINRDLMEDIFMIDRLLISLNYDERKIR